MQDFKPRNVVRLGTAAEWDTTEKTRDNIKALAKPMWRLIDLDAAVKMDQTNPMLTEKRCIETPNIGSDNDLLHA